MFERVYLGPRRRAEHERARDDDPPDLRRTSSTAATRADEIVEFVAGMTDRFALDYAAQLC